MSDYHQVVTQLPAHAFKRCALRCAASAVALHQAQLARCHVAAAYSVIESRSSQVDIWGSIIHPHLQTHTEHFQVDWTKQITWHDIAGDNSVERWTLTPHCALCDTQRHACNLLHSTALVIARVTGQLCLPPMPFCQQLLDCCRISIYNMLQDLLPDWLATRNLQHSSKCMIWCTVWGHVGNRWVTTQGPWCLLGVIHWQPATEPQPQRR